MELKYKDVMNKNKGNLIVSIHIENDTVNDMPTLVFTDSLGQEWVHEDQPLNNGAYVTVLKKKEDSWFFKSENKLVNPSQSTNQ